MSTKHLFKCIMSLTRVIFSSKRIIFRRYSEYHSVARKDRNIFCAFSRSVSDWQQVCKFFFQRLSLYVLIDFILFIGFEKFKF